MSEQTKIEWATHTGGPFMGCSPVSPGCVNCYAWALAESRLEPIFRRAYKSAGFEDWNTRPVWGEKATRVMSKGFWTDAVRINKQHEKAGTRGRWFPSMIDWLDEMPAGIIDQNGHKLEPASVLADFLKLIHDTPNLDWLLLTKRPENWEPRVRDVLDLSSGPEPDVFYLWLRGWLKGVAPPNIWLGTSVEDQPRADERIAELLKIPAAVRFLSVEPFLGPVDLEKAFEVYLRADEATGGCRVCAWPRLKDHIHWVIVGGESGPKARPCNVEWIRGIVRQCQAAGVPCFVKQLGAFVIYEEGSQRKRWLLKHAKGGDAAEWPEDLRVREFPDTSPRPSPLEADSPGRSALAQPGREKA